MTGFPQNPVATNNPIVVEYLKRLRTTQQYATQEGISITQVRRRIKEGRTETEMVGDKVFIVLVASPKE